MASLVHHQAAAPMPMPMPAAAAACGDEESFMPQSFGCFGRSLSRASSGRRLEYRALSVSGGESEERSRQERSARAKLRWKAVAQEIIMAGRRGSGGGSGGHGARRRRAAALPAFSYDSRSYALNFDQGAADE